MWRRLRSTTHRVCEQRNRTSAPDLVKDQNELFGETGHINKGIALAIRSRALLYAASPLFAGEGAAAKWEAGRQSCLRRDCPEQIFDAENH